MLLGLAKGKVGDLVFYRDGGEQRTRTRVIPKNPRSFAQMAQRVKIANVGGIYRAAAEILRDSFTNRPSNQSGYNAFAAGAIINAPYLTSEMAKAGVCIPQPSMASRGTLPYVAFDLSALEDAPGVYLTTDLVPTETTTIGELSQNLLSAYPSLREGYELHFVVLYFRPDSQADLGVDVYNILVDVASLVIDSTSTVTLSNSQVRVVDGRVISATAADYTELPIHMGVIFSSYVDGDGRLQASTSYFELSASASELYDGYRTDAALRDAIESYKASATPTLR